MSRERKTGSLSIKLGLICGASAFVGSAAATALLIDNVSGALAQVEGATEYSWVFGLVLAGLVGIAVGFIAWFRGAAIGTRITDLGLAVAKLGRGGTEVRVRVGGNDEVTALGRAVQYLASDLAALLPGESAAEGAAARDEGVRELRDRALPEELPPGEGYELDGGLARGHRGGLDYYDAVPGELGTALFLVSAEGAGAVSVVACRMARDEILRALKAGAVARKALAHTNRVLQRHLPRGACAKATVVQLGAGEVKVYQAGARTPVLVCARGEVAEHAAEGLALGLDEGPVFEKALRSTSIPVTAGVRVVLVNEAALRVPGFRSLVQTHSPKHTVPFMNLVLGGLEDSEGGLREDVVLVTAKRF